MNRPEHFQNRVLVEQKDIPPHGGVRRRDAGEIAEPPRRVLDHLPRGDDVVIPGSEPQARFPARPRSRQSCKGDQMRQMAGDGQNPVVMLGIHDLDVATQRTPECRQPMRQQNSSAAPDRRCEDRETGRGTIRRTRPRARNARCRPPGAPAPDAQPSGMCGAMASITAPFTEPTSVTIVPGAR